MGFIVNLLLFILAIGILVIVHELGHLIMAKRAGILCHEFSIGMGPKLFQVKGKETLYSVRLLPIGGYVAMAGEEVSIDSSDVPVERRYDGASPLNRGLVAAAGVVMNFLLAIILFFIVTLSVGTSKDTNVIGGVTSGSTAENVIQKGDVILKIGNYSVTNWKSIGEGLRDINNVGVRNLDVTVCRKPSKDVECVEQVVTISPRIAIESIGIYDLPIADFNEIKDKYQLTSHEAPIIGIVQKRDKDGQAYKAGLEKHDIITAVQYGSASEIAINSWADLAKEFARNTNGEKVTIKYKRLVEGVFKEGTVEVKPYKESTLKQLANVSSVYMSMGVAPETEHTFGGALKGTGDKFKSSFTMIARTLMMVFGSSDDVGINDLGGVISMFNMTSSAASNGAITFIYFVGVLSVNLGILNLLPFPALDGGRLVFITIEGITGKKVNPKVENFIHSIGMFLLFGFMIYVFLLDIVRLGS